MIPKIFTVVVTGANGFIGRRLVKRIAREFDPAEILSLTGSQKNSLGRKSRKLIAGGGPVTKSVDLVSGWGLDGLPKSPKLIIHLAASTESVATDHRCNDLGTRNLIEALGPLGPKTHLIFTSTTAVMAGRGDCSLPLDESTPAIPSNEYGRTKLKAEEWLQKKCRRSNFRLTIIRLGTVFGSKTRTNGLFDTLKKLIVKHSWLARLNWPGLTSLIYVDDVADALIMFSQKPPLPGKPELYLLASHSLSLAQISREMHSALEIPFKSINLPRLFWKFCSLGRKYSSHLESILPPKIYNLFWRASLIVDDTLYCQSEKAFKRLPRWKPRHFREAVTEVVS